MAKMEWAMWGSEQTLISCIVLCLGSILGVCSIAMEYPHVRWAISVYGLVMSVLIFLLEYPRGTTPTHLVWEGRFR